MLLQELVPPGIAGVKYQNTWLAQSEMKGQYAMIKQDMKLLKYVNRCKDPDSKVCIYRYFV